MREEKVVVEFSGGKDSTLVALLLGLRDGCELHLLTFDNGNLIAGIDTLHDRIRELRELWEFWRQNPWTRFPPPPFEWKFLSSSELFWRAWGNAHARGWRGEESSPVAAIPCPICVMTRHALAAEYCKEFGIKFLADGSRGSESVIEQHPAFRECVEEWLRKEYEVKYITPLDGFSGGYVVKSLARYGINPNSCEPVCFYSGLGEIGKIDERRAHELIRSMAETAIRYVSEAIEEMKEEGRPLLQESRFMHYVPPKRYEII